MHHSLVSKFPIPNSDGTVTRVGGMAIDITEHQRTQAILEESEQRFRQLAENINESSGCPTLRNPKYSTPASAYEAGLGAILPESLTSSPAPSSTPSIPKTGTCDYHVTRKSEPG